HFVGHGITLRAEDLAHVTSNAEREAQIQAASEDARSWLARQQAARMQLRRGSEVQGRLARKELDTLLADVIADRRDRVSQVRSRLKDWHDRDDVEKRIHQIDRELAGDRERSRPLVGAVLKQLLRGPEEACALAIHWCELVEREQLIE